MDFSHLYCNSHPRQLIINFCNKQQCQVGLCANCICIHTKMHMQKGSSPQYQNVRSTYKNLSDSVTNQVAELQSLNSRIIAIQNKIQQKRVKTKQLVSDAREQTIQLINKFFVFKEQQLLRQIQSQQQKFGLHCKHRLQTLKQSTQKQIENISLIVKQLNCHNFLSILPKFKLQVLHNTKTLATQLSQQIKDNQNFNSSLNYNKNVLNEICKQLNKLIYLNVGKESMQRIQPLPFSMQYVKKSVLQPKQQHYNLPIKQQPKLFTLRRPSSQQSLRTINNNLKKQMVYPNQEFRQNFLSQVSSSQSKATLANKPPNQIAKVSPINTTFRQSSIFEKLIDSEKYIDKKPAQNAYLNSGQQLEKRKYDFTFGSQFKQNQRFRQNVNGNEKNISFSNISQKINPTIEKKTYEPNFVSNIQQKQINNNIKKMQKKSQKFSKYLQNYYQLQKDKEKEKQKDKQFSVDESSSNISQFMYRTQLM